MAPTPLYERITCEDVRVGDRVARSRTHTFEKVIRISAGTVSRRLIFTESQEFSRRPYGRNICPRRTAQLWREVEQPCLPGTEDAETQHALIGKQREAVS